MHIQSLRKWTHSHNYNVDDGHAERNTRRVILLTVFMMVIEISAGYLFGSMALLADGWHMGTHAVALGITAFAYYYARLNSDNPNYSFGTGKVGVLGGFASAVVLAIVALLIQMTVDIYGHLIPSGNRDAVNSLDEDAPIRTLSAPSKNEKAITS